MKNLNFKKIIYCGVVSVGMILSSFAASSDTKRFTVAITQIVPHPSLDLIRKGIEDELREQNVVCDILFENAQGNIALATQIGQKFASQNPDIIVPISTPSAQTVYAAASPKGIKVIFAAVNDPVSSKLVPSMDRAGKGVTGVSDMPPVVQQVALIQEVLPKAQKIGVVYNPGESNSVATLEILEKLLAQKGMTLVRATAGNMVDVTAATKSLVGKVDAIYISNDNTVVAALEGLLKVAKENGMPIFCADPESVKQGCLATVTHSQYGLGRQTGTMVARYLKGTDIQSIPVETPKNVELSVNLDTAKALNITFPEAVLARAQHVVKK
ncbi:MAG: ABC transporter substrate-binding protein [Alphaproteobacteria bacterium]|nr:ABC transporter substrate-binding protein [Alphaproteobacteria bacterium]